MKHRVAFLVVTDGFSISIVLSIVCLCQSTLSFFFIEWRMKVRMMNHLQVFCVQHFLLSKLGSCVCVCCVDCTSCHETQCILSLFDRLTTEKQARTSLLSHQKLAFESIDILYFILVSLLFIPFFFLVPVSRLSSCSIVSCLFSRVKEKTKAAVEVIRWWFSFSRDSLLSSSSFNCFPDDAFPSRVWKSCFLPKPASFGKKTGSSILSDALYVVDSSKEV